MQVLETGKNELDLSFEGKDLGLSNYLASLLAENKDIDFAASEYNHPLKGTPILRLSGSDLKKNVVKALNELQSELSALEKKFSKE